MVINLKKRFLAFVFAFVLLLSPAVLAHSGKTGANGGHYDRSTGEYHYHHGYPAHQHYDMDGDGVVDCPYNFDDQTGRNSGRSSSGSKKSSGQSTYVTPTPTPKKKGIAVPPMLILGICAIPIGATVLIVICAPIYALVDRAVKKRQEKKEKAECTALYTGKAITDLVDIPPGSSIGVDGLPHSGGGGKWGALYTFYVTETGKTYHRKYGCSHARLARNAYNIRADTRLRPCRRCKPELPDTEWVARYQEVKRNADRFGIHVDGL